MPTVSPATGAALRLIVAAMQAKTVVEVGTGAGVAALYILESLAPGGVLTTIDVEAEHQRQAKRSFADAEVPAARTRPILGRPRDVLPRLADGAYDLVLLSERPEHLSEHVDQGLRILRPGGVLAVTDALWNDAVPNPARRDEPVVAIRTALSRLNSDDSVVVSLLPVGSGLLLAAKREIEQ